MNLTKDDPGFEYFNVQYQNSGVTEYGDRERVVGYHAFAVCKKPKEEVFSLSPLTKIIDYR